MYNVPVFALPCTGGKKLIPLALLATVSPPSFFFPPPSPFFFLGSWELDGKCGQAACRRNKCIPATFLGGCCSPRIKRGTVPAQDLLKTPPPALDGAVLPGHHRGTEILRCSSLQVRSWWHSVGILVLQRPSLVSLPLGKTSRVPLEEYSSLPTTTFQPPKLPSQPWPVNSRTESTAHKGLFRRKHKEGEGGGFANKHLNIVFEVMYSD